MALFIRLGLWQYHKAELRQQIENQFQASATDAILNLKEILNSSEQAVFKKVAVQGHFISEYQILLDNQVEGQRAGFHVITPFQIEGTHQYVMINRGWVPGHDQHDEIPAVETPSGSMTLKGLIWLPSKKIFTLEKKENELQEQWKPVWQHLDMSRLKKQIPFPILPVIIKLDPDQPAGFIRNWQLPPSKIMTNLGYAYQWFGFALAAFAIYLYLSISKIKQE